MKLNRTKKIIKALFSLSGISIIVCFLGYVSGGNRVFSHYGLTTEAIGPISLMATAFGIFIISLLTGIGFKALCSDIEENNTMNQGN